MPKPSQQNGMVIFLILFLLLFSELMFLYFEHLFFQQQHLMFYQTEKIRMQNIAESLLLSLQKNLPTETRTPKALLEKPLQTNEYCDVLHALPDKWFGCYQIFSLRIKSNLSYKHLYIIRLLLKFNGLEQRNQREFLLS